MVCTPPPGPRPRRAENKRDNERDNERDDDVASLPIVAHQLLHLTLRQGPGHDSVQALQRRLHDAGPRGAEGQEGQEDDDEQAGADGDHSVGRRRRAARLAHTLPARLALAVERDQRPVVLADGSALTLDDAARLLALKEVDRVFVPLRRAIDHARDAGQAVWTLLDAEPPATLNDGVAPAAPATLTPALDVLDGALQASAPLWQLLLDVVGHLGHAQHDGSTDSLRRLLDLPLGPAAAPLLPTHLMRLASLALPSTAQGQRRWSPAPHDLHGHVSRDGDGGVRLWLAGPHTHAPLRATGFSDAVGGIGSALTALLIGEDDADGLDGPVADALAGGLALSLLTPPVWRALDCSRRDAEHLARVTTATALLRVLVTVATAVGMARAEVDPEAPADEQRRQRLSEVRSGILRRFGVTVDDDILLQALGQHWPDGVTLPAFSHARVRRALLGLRAAGSAARIREALDEGAVLRRHALAPLTEPEVRAAMLAIPRPRQPEDISVVAHRLVNDTTAWAAEALQ